jgi:hypothetical protein
MWLAGTILFLFQITALAFRRAPGFTLAAAE